MKNKILTSMLCLLAAGCVFLAGCSSTKEGDTSPGDTATDEALLEDQSVLENGDISGTWELRNSNNSMVYYLTFGDGVVSYVGYSTEGRTEESAGGSYTIEENGRVIISISEAGKVHENTYSVSITGDTLTLSFADDNTAVEGEFSLAGTYKKSQLPEKQEPVEQKTEAPEKETEAPDEPDASGSPSGKDEKLASFLADTDYFLASTDTFLGNAYENEVTGSFVLSNSDRIEGTFYVSVSQASIGSVNFYIDGDIMHFSNSSMGTYSKCNFEITDTYIRISQIDSDATGEDILNTIVGTWYAHSN